MPVKHVKQNEIPDPAPAAKTPAGEVRRAIDRFRRGAAVGIDGAGAKLIAVAAETLTAGSLAALREAAGGRLRLVMSSFRASALGLEADERAPTAVELRPDVTLAEIVGVVDPLAGTGAPLGKVRRETGDGREGVDAAIALAKLAGLLPMVIVAPAGAETSAAEIPAVDAGDVARFADDSARWLTRVAESRVPLADAEDAHIVAFRPWGGGPEHLAIVVGALDVTQPVLARIHSSCFTGDLLGSLRCDCGEQLRGAIQAIAAAGSGVLVYLPQEGRGIGLVNKLRAYALQDAGLDTIDANLHLGFAPDERTYAAAGEILRQLGVSKIRLLTNNPGKRAAIARLGVEIVERVKHAFPPNPHNAAYLRTKAVRDGHNF